MPDAERQARRSIWKFAAIAFSIVVAFAIGYLASGISTYLGSLTPEYNSAQTIRDVTDFVRDNDAWPTSWTELGSPPLEGVVVNWSLDITSCDRHDVMTAIVPSTRRYMTYPHAESQLDALWEEVRDRQDEP